MLVVGQVQIVCTEVIVHRGTEPHRPEVGVRQDPGPVVVAQPVDATEVVRVAVRHHGRVYVFVAGTHLGEAIS